MQQELPVSEAVEHFALGEEEQCLGQWPCLGLASLLLTCPTIYHCCWWSLFPNKRMENPSNPVKGNFPSNLSWHHTVLLFTGYQAFSDHAPSITAQFPVPASYDITLFNHQCQWSLSSPVVLQALLLLCFPRAPLSFSVNQTLGSKLLLPWENSEQNSRTGLV